MYLSFRNFLGIFFIIILFYRVFCKKIIMVFEYIMGFELWNTFKVEIVAEEKVAKVAKIFLEIYNKKLCTFTVASYHIKTT